MKTGFMAIGFAVLLAALAWCWHPVCVPISPEMLNLFTPVPITRRTGERQWGIQTFQRIDGQWCECKPWLAQQMFF